MLPVRVPNQHWGPYDSSGYVSNICSALQAPSEACESGGMQCEVEKVSLYSMCSPSSQALKPKNFACS